MISVVQLEEAFPARKIAPALEKAFRTKLAFPRQVAHVSRSSLNLARGQWDAEAILEEMEKKFPGKGIVLGLFPHDLYVGSMNFVFGAAQLGGRTAILSYHRLKPPAARKKSEKKAVENLFIKRVEKEAVHELGHVLGLHHCRDEHCVMSFSPSLYWVEFKSREFCPGCSEVFNDLLKERVPGAGGAGAAAAARRRK